MKQILSILVLLSLLFTACYRDVEEVLYPGGGNCDTANVRYASTVVPLLQANGCTGCHGGGAPSGNVSLDQYNGVRTVALNGRLYGTISHSPGFSPMPKGGSKMNSCDIAKIKAWIDAGAPNN